MATMIPTSSQQIFDLGLSHLEVFGQHAGARGRFIALFLALKRLQVLRGNQSVHITSSDLQRFLDELFTKTNRPQPYVVLTAPFGHSHVANAPYSTITGDVAPGRRTATNTWRNNFGIQKGIGCPADPATLQLIINDPQLRQACPHIVTAANGEQTCSLTGAGYRGEKHSIWLRFLPTGGYEVVGLDIPRSYEPYLTPGGNRIPILSLIAVLYSFTPSGVYPARTSVSLDNFAADFGFSQGQLTSLFDCSLDVGSNKQLIESLPDNAAPVVDESGESDESDSDADHPDPSDFPAPIPGSELNTGVTGEILISRELEQLHWSVDYFGNQTGLGYDLLARRQDSVIYVEVKSSVGLCTPILTAREWQAANEHRERFVLAVIDHLGSDDQLIRYVIDPAGISQVQSIPSVTYRVPRTAVASRQVMLNEL